MAKKRIRLLSIFGVRIAGKMVNKGPGSELDWEDGKVTIEGQEFAYPEAWVGRLSEVLFGEDEDAPPASVVSGTPRGVPGQEPDFLGILHESDPKFGNAILGVPMSAEPVKLPVNETHDPVKTAADVAVAGEMGPSGQTTPDQPESKDEQGTTGLDKDSKGILKVWNVCGKPKKLEKVAAATSPALLQALAELEKDEEILAAIKAKQAQVQ